MGCTDVNVRTEIHTEAMQSGLAMQHLGALLLELGRTMLTLRIGQSHVYHVGFFLCYYNHIETVINNRLE